MAGRLAITRRVYAHLLGETRDRQARQAPRDAHRVERFQQVDRPVLDAAQQRDARGGAIAEQHGIGRARMLEHVEAVREQRGGLVDTVGLVRERRAHRREHAGQRMAAPEIGFRTRQRRRQRVVGQPDLALTQVAQARDQLAPTRDIAEPGRRLAARRRVLEAARLRRLADDDRARRQPVRVHLREPGRRRRREVGPRFEQLDEMVDFVGVIRGRAEDQRAFVAHRRRGAGIREDARDLAPRLDMALAERQRPGHRDAQRRTLVEFRIGQQREPVEHVVDAALLDRIFEATLRERIRDLELAGRIRVAGGFLGHPVRVEPGGRTRMQRAALGIRARGQAVAQRVAHERMQPAPVRIVRRNEQRRVACEPRETVGRVRVVEQRGAQRRMQAIGDARAGQERGVLGRQVREQQLDQPVARAVHAGGERVDRLARIGRARHRGHRELQPERPAVDAFEQPRARVGVDPLRKACADQRDRLVEREAQPVGARERALPAGEQVAGHVVEPAPRGDDDMQVLRRVVQHVGQRVEAGRRQPLRIVDDQQRIDRQLRDLGQPRGHAFQRARRVGRADRDQAPEAGPRAAGPHRLHEPLQQPRRIVALVGRQPDDRTAEREGFAAPLREQRRLAVTGRRLHERDRPAVESGRGEAQPRAGQQLRRHARRGRLQDQFGGRRVGAIGWAGHRGCSRNPAVPCGPASGVGVGGRIGRTAFARQSPPRRVGPHRHRVDSMGSDA
ncbi:hypothetical protein BLA39750_03897 [Burkholderia lata]|uniref:Uncharacterized protein n=1 Tax=Burkholderia lata (strain ATCC 17760 / DSM 23089 / LMG 22485 / NCIMB 9086 / R18194 / 383) TaxID=482957 RepID=A0A6P2YEI6_BURL3|nr:hypothetical protein BLA39750_03897 [Burkholderia lata]